ncbi:ABC transporter substrate-binding protein [Paenibacillus soyae]|uniref:ABC transporter substrate-binding protein n=1 Tax=Paenibacillus soyae TaxID=2969249 RepID=A0A9X2MP97_9BACL|nr:ABC transporter substrate-binding protein [Paenibacillus soyae]MCR2805693.1 ABC transporter substrate-binding protein [Paenibacillus soyae]
MEKTKWSMLAILLIVAMTVAGCAGGGGATNNGQAATGTVPSGAANANDGIDLPPAEKKSITLRLNWKFKGEFAPFFVTKEKGIFEKYGLDVDVLEGSGSVAVLQVVAENREEIGVTSAVEPIQGVELGMPVKIIASYMSKSPIMILSHADTPVRSPKDLEGKKLVSSSGSTFSSIYERFLEHNGTDYNKVEHMMVETSARNTLFLNKDADAVAVFSTNEYPLFEKTLGEELVPLYLADYGFDLTGLSLIANDKFLQDNPNTVKRFLAAVNEGMAYSMEHPEEAASIAKELFPEVVDEEIVIEQIKRTGELALRPEGKPFGWTDGDKMNGMVDLMLESELIEGRKSVEQYFTNDYFEN